MSPDLGHLQDMLGAALDMRRIWTTVTDRLPELASAIEDFMKDIP